MKKAAAQTMKMYYKKSKTVQKLVDQRYESLEDANRFWWRLRDAVAAKLK